jgi:hypothetical protein
MISKYTYKDLTWVDLESPTEDELAHIIENKPDNSLHFIVGDDTLVTSRQYSTPQIATFAKNFEMNLALEKPVQMDTIDLLFFELLSFFRQHKESVDNDKLLKEKDDDISSLLNINHKISKVYKRKILYLRIFLFIAIVIISYLYIWR